MHRLKLSNEDRRTLSLLMLRLIGMYLGEIEDDISVAGSDLQALYTVAKENSLCALVAVILQSRGIRNELFSQRLAKAQRKSLLYDRELSALTKVMDQTGVRYLPLKGMMIKSLYPGVGLREMSDIDILIDSASAETVRELMLSRGFTVEEYGKSHHDIYHKQPFYNIEIHRALFDEMVFPEMARYFEDKQYLSARKDGPFFGITPDDIYIYLTAHTYGHYSMTGTGLRSLLDLHLFLKRYASTMDFDHIEKETQKLGISAYEKKTRRLAGAMFSPESLSAEDKTELDYYIFSGVHGSFSNYVRNRIIRKTGSKKYWRAAYIADRVQATPKHIKYSPFFSKHPSLSGLMVVTRPVKMVLTRPKRVADELKEIVRYKKNQE